MLPGNQVVMPLSRGIDESNSNLENASPIGSVNSTHSTDAPIRYDLVYFVLIGFQNLYKSTVYKYCSTFLFPLTWPCLELSKYNKYKTSSRNVAIYRALYLNTWVHTLYTKFKCSTSKRQTPNAQQENAIKHLCCMTTNWAFLWWAVTDSELCSSYC